MGQWKDIPYEVKEPIVELLEEEGGSWFSANKEMYNLLQSFKFKSISIDLNNPDTIFNSILSSPFNPGQHVKEVTLTNLSTLKTMHLLNPAINSLYQLIKHTPNVKDLQVYQAPKMKDWNYIALALSENDNWTLHSLPYYYEDDGNPTAYINCAYSVRNSLTQHNLTRGMIGRSKFARLAEFKQLTKLTVGENVLKDLFDCNKLLQHLPQLETLEVKGFSIDSDLPEIAQVNNTATYTNIKNLSLYSYQPSTENELLHIMKTYTDLDHLVMGVDERRTVRKTKGASWPVSTISRSVLVSFMKFSQTSKSYRIAFGGIAGETWLMDLLFHCQMGTGENGQRANFILAKEDDYGEKEFELLLSSDKDSSNMIVELNIVCIIMVMLNKGLLE